MKQCLTHAKTIKKPISRLQRDFGVSLGMRRDSRVKNIEQKLVDVETGASNSTNFHSMSESECQNLNGLNLTYILTVEIFEFDFLILLPTRYEAYRSPNF